MAGTDCGFSTFAGFGKIDEEICYKKLSSLVEGATLASKLIMRKMFSNCVITRL